MTKDHKKMEGPQVDVVVDPETGEVLAKGVSPAPAGDVAVVNTAGSEGAVTTVDSEVDDSLLVEVAGDGNQLVTGDDVALPIIKLLQTNSPEVQRQRKDTYIEGAKDGDFFNSLTREVYGPEVEVIDCFFHPVVLEWPPGRGAGLRGIHELDSPRLTGLRQVEIKGEDGRPKVIDQLPNGNTATRVNQHLVLIRSKRTGRWEEAVLPLSSTQLKKSRRLNANLGLQKILDKNGQERRTPDGRPLIKPRYGQVLLLRSVGEQRDTNAWWGVEFEIARNVTVGEFHQARAFKDLAVAGSVTIRHEDTVEQNAAASGDEHRSPRQTGMPADGDPREQPPLDDTIPY